MIAITTDQDARVEIPYRGGHFTAVIRPLTERERLRCNGTFMRVSQGLTKLTRRKEAVAALKTSTDSEAVDASVKETELLMRDMESTLTAMLECVSYGLRGIEGACDGDGHPIRLPKEREGVQGWLEQHLSYGSILELTCAVMAHNTLTDRDRGN